ncbi:hypothetical protein MCHI_000206 [Candidatus Magnetoovum chiemensis]|nr:hypothetical protein MCHI_000206 [Candidatus Magnetoovum chiemensis]
MLLIGYRQRGLLVYLLCISMIVLLGRRLNRLLVSRCRLRLQAV